MFSPSGILRIPTLMKMCAFTLILSPSGLALCRNFLEIYTEVNFTFIYLILGTDFGDVCADLKAINATLAPPGCRDLCSWSIPLALS